MKKLFLMRWPVGSMLVLIALVALVPAFTLFHNSRPIAAHASGSTPTLTMPGVLHPYDVITITGQGFNPNDQVNISIDDPNNFPIGTLTCDLTGSCSGQMNVPNYYVQGLHQIFGTTRSGLSVQVSVTFLPGISVWLSSLQEYKGGPGSSLELRGGSFTSNESMALSWGNQQLSSSLTTDWNGSFDTFFSAPTGIASGNYAITVTRTNQVPATVSTVFTILPPGMRSAAGVRNSQPVHVQLSGFQGNEQVALSWNANGGQAITTLSVDSTGALDTYFVPPFAPSGSYVLTATGTSSGLKASSNLAIGPGILLTPNTINPGGTTSVSGGGFTPGETVNVYFQSIGNGVTPVVIDASGSFSVSLTIPVAHKQNVAYYVYAVSTSTSNKAKAQVFYATPSIHLSGGLPSYGYSFSVSGQGFAAQETVTLTWSYPGLAHPIKLGTVVVADDGTFSFTTTARSVPYAPAYQNTILIVAHGSSGKTSASLYCSESPDLIPTPSSAQMGQKVSVKGGGFGSLETVTITLENIQVATTTTNASGAFSTTFVVPSNAGVGGNIYSLIAIGSSSGAVASAFFDVLPTLKISPGKGPSGTVITVTGSHYKANSLVMICWNNPSTILVWLTTSATGDFTTTITAPANLVSGQTYYVMTVADVMPNVQVPFVAQ